MIAFPDNGNNGAPAPLITDGIDMTNWSANEIEGHKHFVKHFSRTLPAEKQWIDKEKGIYLVDTSPNFPTPRRWLLQAPPSIHRRLSAGIVRRQHQA